MADDATNPVAAQDTPAPETEVADETPETETDADEADQAPAEPETEEVEWEGQKYRVPKPLKTGLMLHADYTRKTQEVAETRKALESAQERFNQEQESHKAYLQDHARMLAYDMALEPFKNVTWDQWIQSDPVAANAAWMRFTRLKSERDDAEKSVREKEAKGKSEADAAQAKRLQERHAVFAREVPGWSQELANKLDTFATGLGFKPAEMAELTDPRYVNVLRLAHIGAQLEKQTRAAAKATQTEAKPVPTVRTAGNSSAGQLRDDLSPEEWVKRRNAQEARAREARIGTARTR